MPYIKAGRERLKRDPWSACNPGELNFVISTLLGRYIADMTLSYATINECIGVLECAKLELYRRIAVPYEGVKIAENGDVYLPELGNFWPEPDVEQAAREVDRMRGK